MSRNILSNWNEKVEKVRISYVRYLYVFTFDIHVEGSRRVLIRSCTALLRSMHARPYSSECIIHNCATRPCVYVLETMVGFVHTKIRSDCCCCNVCVFFFFFLPFDHV